MVIFAIVCCHGNGLQYTHMNENGIPVVLLIFTANIRSLNPKLRQILHFQFFILFQVQILLKLQGATLIKDLKDDESENTCDTTMCETMQWKKENGTQTRISTPCTLQIARGPDVTHTLRDAKEGLNQLLLRSSRIPDKTSDVRTLLKAQRCKRRGRDDISENLYVYHCLTMTFVALNLLHLTGAGLTI